MAKRGNVSRRTAAKKRQAKKKVGQRPEPAEAESNTLDLSFESKFSMVLETEEGGKEKIDVDYMEICLAIGPIEDRHTQGHGEEWRTTALFYEDCIHAMRDAGIILAHHKMNTSHMHNLYLFLAGFKDRIEKKTTSTLR